MPRSLTRQAAWPSMDAFRFPVGRKQIFLPNFTVTLLRSPDLPPRMARFIVPLSFNKLDLKDYLYHAYNVPVLNVRSYIVLQPLEQGSRSRFVSRQWRRPRSIKHMIVEMIDPFVWPEEEQDLEGWDKTAFEAAEKAQEDYSQKQQLGRLAPRIDHKHIKEQAKKLLEGREKWRPTWMSDGISNGYGSSSRARL